MGNEKCNEDDVTSLDLSAYPELKSISIGDDSFSNVDVLHIEGMNKLETLTIGKNSFTKDSLDTPNYDRKFYLKDCPMLKNVAIGTNSFSDYTYSSVENLASLESIAFGAVEEESNNFYNVNYASFEGE